VRFYADFLFLALVFAPALARAQGNDRSAPTGGRTALMGNTGIALGEDGASPFMNPATILRIHDNSFAFSVNFYNFADQHFSDWHQPGPVDAAHFGTVALSGSGISSNGLNVLPSTLCIFATTAAGDVENELGLTVGRGRQKLALCFATLESQSTSLAALAFNGATSLGTTAQVQSIAENFTRFQIGPTYSIALTNQLSIGMSLHGALTDESFTLEGSSITSVTGGGAAQSSLGAGGSGHSFDVLAILGATYRVGRVTFGLSGQLPALHIFGGYSGVLHNADAEGTTNTSTLTNGSGNFEAPPPIRVGAGVGVNLPRLVLELDGSFDFGSGTAFSTNLTGTTTKVAAAGPTNSSLSATYSVATRPVFNLAAGGELFLTRTLSLLGGASSNLTSLPGLSPSMTLGNLTPSRTSWINAAFGLGSYGSAGSLRLGAVLGFGWGEAIAINPYVLPNDWAVVDTQSYSATLVLSGTLNFETVGQAVKEVQGAVKNGAPDPTGQPPGKRP
jgi:hypothetical protein